MAFVVLLACIVALAACASRSKRFADVGLAGGTKISNVNLFEGEGSAILFYRTATPVGACNPIRAEVREVWRRFAQREAEKRAVEKFSLMPEDETGYSRAFSYVRRDSEWVEGDFSACPE
jgi:hypothetical protein